MVSTKKGLFSALVFSFFAFALGFLGNFFFDLINTSQNIKEELVVALEIVFLFIFGTISGFLMGMFLRIKIGLEKDEFIVPMVGASCYFFIGAIIFFMIAHGSPLYLLSAIALALTFFSGSWVAKEE